MAGVTKSLSSTYLRCSSSVSVFFSLLVPILIGDAIDCIVENGVLWERLTSLILSVLASAAASALTQFLAGLCNNYVSCNVVRDLRRDAFYKIAKLPLSYLDTHPRGDTVSRIVADADQFSDGLLIGFTQLFTGVLTILGTVAAI